MGVGVGGGRALLTATGVGAGVGVRRENHPASARSASTLSVKHIMIAGFMSGSYHPSGVRMQMRHWRINPMLIFVSLDRKLQHQAEVIVGHVRVCRDPPALV